MKILGKTVSNKFQLFYKDIAPGIGVPIRFERGPYRAMGNYWLQNRIARIRLDTSLIRPHFEETAAHELLHALQDSELWPTTARSANLPDNSPEAIVGSELGALVRDLNVLETLQTLGFNADYSNDTRYRSSNWKGQRMDLQLCHPITSFLTLPATSLTLLGAATQNQKQETPIVTIAMIKARL